MLALGCGIAESPSHIPQSLWEQGEEVHEKLTDGRILMLPQKAEGILSVVKGPGLIGDTGRCRGIEGI